MKKIKLSMTLFAVALMAVIAIACKKENQSPEDLLTEAKNWYNKSSKASAAYLVSNKDAVKTIKQIIDWSTARVFKFENGSEVVGAQISMTYGDIPLKGSFILLISKENNSFRQLVAHSEKNGYFNMTIADSDIELLFKTATNENAKHKREKASGSKGKQSLLPPSSGQCIDWYLTNYYYDDYGNLLYTTEVYLYTTCDEGGGGIGGVSDDPQEEACNNASGEAAASPVSVNIGEITESSTADKRVKIYEWKFLENAFGFWNYTSKEKGVHKKVGTEWQWESLEHFTDGRNGTVLVASITVDHVKLIPDVGKYYAGGVLYFNFDSSFICKGVPGGVSGSWSSKSPLWNVNN